MNSRHHINKIIIRGCKTSAYGGLALTAISIIINPAILEIIPIEFNRVPSEIVGIIKSLPPNNIAFIPMLGALLLLQIRYNMMVVIE
jgi:hypothetical protein